jgi:phosphonate transport system ATP-binding protein
VSWTLQGVAARHPAAAADAPPALHPLDLVIAPGEQVAVIGPSGAGKTTLLALLSVALPPAAGTLCVDGQDPWALPRAALQRLRRGLFLAPQVPPLPPRQRVVSAVLAARLPSLGLFAALRQWLHPTDLDAPFDALERFGLGDKLFERVDRLSGGERQRVGLARAWLSPARAWLVDEPLSALDPTRSRQAITALTEEARARGVTLVASLHQVDVALRHFPRVLGLRDGRLQFDLPAAQVDAARLTALYAEHEHELHGAPPLPPGLDDQLGTPAAPVVMTCR